ncbi:porin [Sulfitobacter mediterraneus]|uniref:porin n=1 Tax=Sulfitobacter TaxID=60136 RepID=UPI001931B20E|nr:MULTISPECIES: porin [Sulfitobacter]MBM1632686.1 porin [Sulfitobacter mediterraneus]MBM1641180.1 porin [Sulfitobacter mediterraneus]MBM1644551.1 porin [Sulfitobacter mediterraneus]MBM1649300.1 porin [Sulfitobacter mediterraneus]MBM1653321.1 porin [Sulfitobacter mediterraneus]
MKKVLFATTALVATAGVAAADVTFGGWGRFGILYNEANVGNETNITSRFRLQIDATAESDGGVTFGARVRMQQNNTDNGNSPAGTGFNGARFFARSGGLEVGVGNIYGAIEFMPGMYPIDLGLTGLGYEYTAYQFRADAYSSGGNGSAGSNGVEVLYSMGDLSFHVSASDTNDRIAAHAAYSWNGWTFALGAQDSNNAADTELAASVSGSFGPVDVTLAYADNGTAGDHITLAGRFDVGAATNVEVYVADADNFANTSYGVDFNHDLGGGTSLRGGIASLSNDTVRADLGVRFNF